MSDQRNTILEARNIFFEDRGFEILNVGSLSVHEGEVLSLIGPNGAGKSTLLQSLAKLQGTSDGEIIYKGKLVGRDISSTQYRRSVTMVFQETLLFDTTVFKNVSSGLRFRRIRSKDRERIVMENLETFGIAHLKNRSVRTLSGGEARRVSLARSFAVSPEIIFLDEPFSALDPPTHESIITDLGHILKKSRTTAVFATHDRSEALRLSDRICVMQGGKILQVGEADEVINRPADEFVASFVGVETILHGVVDDVSDGTISVNIGTRQVTAVSDAKPGQEVLLCIRPEHVSLSNEARSSATSERNAFAGTVTDVVSHGLYYRVTVDCGFSLTSFVTPGSARKLSLKQGLSVYPSFKATAVHVLKR